VLSATGRKKGALRAAPVVAGHDLNGRPSGYEKLNQKTTSRLSGVASRASAQLSRLYLYPILYPIHATF